MPPAKKTPTINGKPLRRTSSSEDLNAAIERIAPDVLALLADGVPRSTAAIVVALADRHSKQDVKRALARLSVLGQLDLQGSRYTLAAAEAKLIAEVARLKEWAMQARPFQGGAAGSARASCAACSSSAIAQGSALRSSMAISAGRAAAS